MSKSEEVDVVDARDKVVASSTVAACLEKGLLHRAVAVVIARPNGRVILQQRSLKDRWHPGRWTLSCTGHVRKGESYHGAASRELQEELGISAALSPVKKYLLPPMTDSGLTEQEWVTLYSGVSSREVKIDHVELEGVKEFTDPELRRMLDGDALTPDAVILLTEYLRGAGRGGRPTLNT